MFLKDFILDNKANKTFATSGIDSIELCLDKLHYETYPYPVEYRYNSYGFRDQEWPEKLSDLRNAIWCVGDSFTVGLGNQEQHMWSKMLEQRLGTRCINVSLDGASNQWIARKIKRIQEEINPSVIIAQWTYITRSENADTSLTDGQRRMHCDPWELAHLDPQGFYTKFDDLLLTMNKNVIHSAIPKFNIFDRPAKFIKDIYQVERLDFSRDGFHYGPLSTDKFVSHLCKHLKTIN